MFNTFKAQLVPIEMHEGPIGRHYGIQTIVNKLLNMVIGGQPCKRKQLNFAKVVKYANGWGL